MAILKSIAGLLYSNGEQVSVIDSGTVLSGDDLTAVGIVGTSPEATLYGDGTIIGSSDNGTFTKWANGDLTVLCVTSTLSTTLVSGDNFYGTESLTYPIVFIAAPVVAMGINVVSGLPIGSSFNTNSTTGISCYLIAAATAQTGKIGLTLTGRWK